MGRGERRGGFHFNGGESVGWRFVRPTIQTALRHFEVADRHPEEQLYEV
jgi:hypothetical protein